MSTTSRYLPPEVRVPKFSEVKFYKGYDIFDTNPFVVAEVCWVRDYTDDSYYSHDLRLRVPFMMLIETNGQLDFTLMMREHKSRLVQAYVERFGPPVEGEDYE